MPIIEEARAIVSCPGRNFVTLKIITDDGAHGVGDATLNGRELAVRSYLADHVVPCLIGPVTMAAIAAVDMALWVIKGKIACLPPYPLLGGASRDCVMVYCHANGETIDDTIAQALKYRAAGYRAIRLQSGVPGLAKTYGVSKDNGPYEPANAALPQEASWSAVKYLPSVAPLFAAAREALGSDVHLLHDAHHRLTPIEAARLCKDLEPYRPFWVEDAVADVYFDTIDELLATPAFRPRALFERFNIEVLATTESPIDLLLHHQTIRASGWPGRVITAFRPDPVDLAYRPAKKASRL